MDRFENQSATKPSNEAHPPVRPPGASSVGNDETRFKRYKTASSIIIVLLVILLAFAGAIILEQRRVTQQMEAQSAKAYGRFLKQAKPAASGVGSDILMRNVRYCWSKAICIDTDRLTATALPMTAMRDIVFDDLNSFVVRVHNAKVLISPKTLQGMFNESVFNYPGSNLRNLTVDIREAGKSNRIKLAGSLKYFLWIPFEMETNLNVDKATNTLVISVYKLQVFGFIPATWLLEFKPFNLQKLLTLPPNRHMTIHRNRMLVKPFGLFPPPRIEGKMDDITVMPRLIQLSFRDNERGFASAGASSITLRGGNAQFGKILMKDADIQVYDQNPRDAFRFSLLNYLNYLPRSQVHLQSDGGVTLHMPDNASVPDMGASPR